MFLVIAITFFYNLVIGIGLISFESISTVYEQDRMKLCFELVKKQINLGWRIQDGGRKYYHDVIPA